MSLIEGIGDEVTNFLIIVISATVIYLAWRSTNVRDERIPRTAVLVIESNRRRLLDRVTQHPVTISILRNASQQHSTIANETDRIDEIEFDETTTSSTIAQLESIPEPPSLQLVLDEVNDLTAGLTYPTTASSSSSSSARTTTALLTGEFTDNGPQEIIRNMDNTDNTDGVRRRIVRQWSLDTTTTTTNDMNRTSEPNTSLASTSNSMAAPLQPMPVPPSTLLHQDSSDKSEHTDNCTNENSENGNVAENMERNNITNSSILNVTRETVTTSAAAAAAASTTTKTTMPTTPQNEAEFRIKLKYLNDDLKLVKGTPNEAIGDFKKRNFSTELSNQKIVRLVFNGHVLQPDSKTLQACGLFDNCVVHCLVHNQRPSQIISTASITPSAARSGDTAGTNNDDGTAAGLDNTMENNQVIISNGQRIVYIGMVLLCVALIFLWYFRIQYFQLFTWYSTIGLFLLTALFLVIIPIVYLIERDINERY